MLSPSLFLPFFHSFILCLIVLFVLGISARHPLIPRRPFFWLGYKVLMKAFRANVDFLFPWGSRRPDNVTEASANRLVENTAASFPPFILTVSVRFSSTLRSTTFIPITRFSHFSCVRLFYSIHSFLSLLFYCTRSLSSFVVVYV